MKDYNFNPRIRELIEKQRGLKSKLSNIESETIIHNVIYDNKYSKDINYTIEDKSKLIEKIVELDLNSYDVESLNNLVGFIKIYFNTFHINQISKIISKRIYFPGRIINQIRTYNVKFEHFISQFDDIEKVYSITINSKFIGDIKKIFDDISYNDETAVITDKKFESKFINFIDNIKQEFNLDIKIIDDVFFLTTIDKNIINIITEKYKGLQTNIIPKFYFDEHTNV